MSSRGRTPAGTGEHERPGERAAERPPGEPHDRGEQGPEGGGGALELALFTDLYELTMLRAYHAEGMTQRAVFSLFVRDTPPERNFLLAAGLEDALAYLEGVRFSGHALDYLASLGQFPPDFLDWLSGFRFTGDVYAVPEGTPVFPDEPLLEVDAPIGEAQLVETFVLNQITFQTLIASKGIRSVLMARGKPVIDFGSRRSHGIDAALKAARALYIVGFASTSNVEAGRLYGIPVTGTMAHSYVQAHDDEVSSFRAFIDVYPETVLLVDTYDVDEATRHVIRLAEELGERFRVRALRLDSGDVVAQAHRVRAMLDEAGLQRVGIVVSGGLDEHSIAAMEAADAPIGSYAVGTRVNTSVDAPKLETVYKLVAYGGEGRIKLSERKATLPGRKQVFRRFEGGEAVEDVLARHDEPLEGEPLLRPVMRDGQRVHGPEPLDEMRERAAREVARLPARLRALEPADPAYPVRLSAGLEEETERARAAARHQAFQE